MRSIWEQVSRVTRELNVGVTAHKDPPNSQTQLHKSTRSVSPRYSVGLDSVILYELRWMRVAIRGIYGVRWTLGARERDRSACTISFYFFRDSASSWRCLDLLLRSWVKGEKMGNHHWQIKAGDESRVHIHLMADREANIKTSLMSSRSGSIIRDAFHRSALALLPLPPWFRDTSRASLWDTLLVNVNKPKPKLSLNVC